MSSQIKNKSIEEKPLNYWQKRDLEREVEAKKRRNVFMSRRSGEEGGTAYETSQSSFVGGKVQSRSRVSLVGRNNEGEVGRAAVESVRGRLGFAKLADKSSAKTGFAKSVTRASAGGTPASKSSPRPLGLH